MLEIEALWRRVPGLSLRRIERLVFGSTRLSTTKGNFSSLEVKCLAGCTLGEVFLRFKVDHIHRIWLLCDGFILRTRPSP